MPVQQSLKANSTTTIIIIRLLGSYYLNIYYMIHLINVYYLTLILYILAQYQRESIYTHNLILYVGTRDIFIYIRNGLTYLLT